MIRFWLSPRPRWGAAVHLGWHFTVNVTASLRQNAEQLRSRWTTLPAALDMNSFTTRKEQATEGNRETGCQKSSCPSMTPKAVAINAGEISTIAGLIICRQQCSNV
ncbi:hypothetical protein BST61_g11483 [Cercospora zeina]